MQATEEPYGDMVAAFLRGMSALDHAQSHNVFDNGDGTRTQGGPATRQTPVRYKRTTQREQLQELRAEASVLRQRFQELYETKQLRRLLDQMLGVPDAEFANWKESATKERHAKAYAEEQKTELMEQISSNTKLLEYVRNLLLIQTKNLPPVRLSARCMSFVPEGDDAQLFLVMKSGLDYQHSRLDAILQQCVTRIDTPEKRDTCIHADGRGVDVRELQLKPFDAVTIGSAVQQHFEGRSHFRWQGENEVVRNFKRIGCRAVCLTDSVLCVSLSISKGSSPLKKLVRPAPTAVATIESQWPKCATKAW